MKAGETEREKAKRRERKAKKTEKERRREIQREEKAGNTKREGLKDSWQDKANARR